MCIQCDLKDRFGDELIFIEPDDFNEAILGVTHDLRVMYDADVCLAILMGITGTEDIEEGHRELDTLMNGTLGSKSLLPVFTWIDWDLIEAYADDGEHDDAPLAH